jgi:DNA-binding Lrp family transcriptional regulator
MSHWRLRWLLDKLGGAAVGLLLLGVLGVVGQLSPYLRASASTPVWLLVWFVAAVTLMMVLQLFRSAPTPVFVSQLATGDSKEGEAYILLEVQPGHSEAIARTLSKSNVVPYAAAVWGSWDVILRVQAGTPEAFTNFLGYVHAEVPEVRRTETFFVRRDQPRDGIDLRDAGKWAFIMLKLEAQRTPQVLTSLVARLKGQRSAVGLQHVAGVFGSYDIVLTVRFAQYSALKKFVMDEIQLDSGAESLTILAIEDLVFIDGERAG